MWRNNRKLLAPLKFGNSPSILQPCANQKGLNNARLKKMYPDAGLDQVILENMAYIYL
jgi:hypothetical protein